MMTKCITWTLAFFAKRSKNVTVQATLATIHGLVSIFGVGPAFVIVLKLKSKAEKEQAKHARKTGSGVPGVRNQNGDL
jgi:hypothetical protein